jgi:hypothetical protein
VDSSQLPGPNWLAKDSSYKELEIRILALELDDFESQEKFDLFSRFINHKRTEELRLETLNSFIDNSLGKLGILTMGDFFLGVLYALK